MIKFNRRKIKILTLIISTQLVQGCLEQEYLYQTSSELLIIKRPGSANQYIIKNADGSRAAIIKPRPGSTKEYVIITNEKRVGFIKKSDILILKHEN